MSISSIILISLIAIVVILAIYIYNRLITLDNRTKEAWSDISVQLKRRYDLIPNLINTVKGYASHEKETLQKITEARSKAINAGTMEEHSQADNMLTGALKSLFAVSENYPDLKANQNFLELQEELADTENKIQASRRFYNINVRDLNTKIETFPSNIIAKVFKFKIKDFFEVENSVERDPVKVNF